MRTRFVREVSCVHGYFQDCTFLLDSGEPCPGGTSREVTVDYEAAAVALAELDGFVHITESTKQGRMGRAKIIVDAALGGGR